jgi:exosortase K
VTRFVRENALALAVSAALAAGTKAAFSRCGPDDLRWMTAPIQALVGLLTGIDFAYEAGYGYVSFERHLVIAKSCTGVNYLLAVFGLLAVIVIPKGSGRWAKLPLVAVLASCAYGVTVVVNSVRIAVGVAVHDGGYAWGWLDASRVHRLAGIVVYFVSLLAVHAIAQRLLARAPAGALTPTSLLAAPLLCYAVVAIAVPLANGAFAARPRLFLENSAWIVLVTLLVSACVAWRPRRP